MRAYSRQLFSRILPALAFCGLALAQAQVQAQAVNAVGWPQPYKQITPESQAWLKSKGWWPMTMAWQPNFSGQNATVVTMAAQDLLGKRGIELKLDAKPAGGAVNKAIVAGEAQLGAGGNFPLTLLIEQNAPIRVVAVTAPNLKHQVIVPSGSKIQSMKDFKGSNPPAVIAMALGSSSEFYFQASAAANGLRMGVDVVLKNMGLAEQMTFPEGVAAIVPWDPVATLVTQEMKTGRAVDVSYPYNVYQGSFVVRKELLDSVPDVASAITDALVEADLWVRHNPDQAARTMAERADMATLPLALLRQQISEYNLLYKPTYMFPLGRFWGVQNQDVALWLHINGKIKRNLSRSDFEEFFVAGPMTDTYKTLGWKVPLLPPFIGRDWMLKSRALRLPEYSIYTNMAKPQAWPEAADLTGPYEFSGKRYRP